MSLPGKILQNLLKLFPYVKDLENRIHNFEKYSSFSPGHYYSPLVDRDEFISYKKYADKINDFPEINFNESQQLIVLKEFTQFYKDLPFSDEPQKDLRYFYNNNFFTYSDAIGLFCMLRKVKPKRIIEIGSGFSSSIILDTNELFFNSKLNLTFIDPNAERLKKLLRENEHVEIIEQKIQEIDPKIFLSLNEGDFLLIDTSHVSKSGSDVNHIYFNILPIIKKGVFVHIHDIFYPFEYPDKWVIDEKRSWNELYLLRALLSYSNAFEIAYFNTYIENKNLDFVKTEMPLLSKRNDNVCGGIWIKRV